MKDIIFLVTGVAAVALFCYITNKDKTKEHFGNIPAQTFKRMPEVRVQNRYQSEMFSVPPTYQGNLPPRFSNTGYGAYILYNIPEEGNLGVPSQPLTFGGNVREGYAQEATSDRSGLVRDIQAMPMMRDTAQQAAAAQKFISDASQGQFQTGEGIAMPDGTQIYNYDRLVYAQKRSRLHGFGDPIRGDLPIVPIQGDWFRPSAYPNIDLRQGAVTTISGHDNTTAKELRALQADFSGKSALAQKEIMLDGRQADITVTAFP